MARTIADQWKKFEEMIEMPAGVDHLMRAAFFSGAAACLSSLIEDKHEPWHASATRIKDELEARIYAKARH